MPEPHHKGAIDGADGASLPFAELLDLRWQREQIPEEEFEEANYIGNLFRGRRGLTRLRVRWIAGEHTNFVGSVTHKRWQISFARQIVDLVKEISANRFSMPKRELKRTPSHDGSGVPVLVSLRAAGLQIKAANVFGPGFWILADA